MVPSMCLVTTASLFVLELDDDRWDHHFMADIAGAQDATMKMKKVGVTLKMTNKTKQPCHNLKVIKKLLHHLNSTTLFGMPWNECRGKCIVYHCRPYCCSSNKCHGTNYIHFMIISFFS